MMLQFATVDVHGSRACVVYPRRPGDALWLPTDDDAFVRGLHEDLWTTVNGGRRLVVFDLAQVRQVTSYFAGTLIDVKSWLRQHRGDLRLCNAVWGLGDWFSCVLRGDPLYTNRTDALHAEHRA